MNQAPTTMNPILGNSNVWSIDNVKNTAILKIGVAVVGALALAGCSSSSKANSSSTTFPRTNAPANCTTLAKEAPSVIEPSIYGQLYVQNKDGSIVLDSPNKASTQIEGEICKNLGALATAYEIAQIYNSNNPQIPTNLPSRINSDIKLFETNLNAKNLAEKDAIATFNILTATTPNQPFSVIKGASELVANGTNSIGMVSSSLPVGVLQGFEISANYQQLNLSAAQKARIKTLGSNILITPPGNVIINETLQSSSSSTTSTTNNSKSPTSTIKGSPNGTSTPQGGSPNGTSTPQGGSPNGTSTPQGGSPTGTTTPNTTITTFPSSTTTFPNTTTTFPNTTTTTFPVTTTTTSIPSPTTTIFAYKPPVPTTLSCNNGFNASGC